MDPQFKKLFIPGPAMVHPDVLAKMATPMISHRSSDASNLQRSIANKLQQLMFTNNTIVLSTSSGTGLMEGAIRSVTRKKAIVFAVGAFGKRWHELAQLNGIDADIHTIYNFLFIGRGIVGGIPYQIAVNCVYIFYKYISNIITYYNEGCNCFAGNHQARHTHF